MSWINKALPKPHRDPYELWYFGAEADAGGDDQLDPDSWYPALYFFRKTVSSEPRIDLWFELLEWLKNSVASTVVTNHDFLHAVFLAIKEGIENSELILFLKGDVDKDNFSINFNTFLSKHGVEAELNLVGGPVGNVAGTSFRDEDLEQFLEKIVKGFTAELSDLPVPKMGVLIDHAIGFANEVFCTNSDGGRVSRFLAVWDQETRNNDGSMVVGRAFSQASFNAELLAIDGSHQRLEASFYTALKLVRPAASDFRRGDIGALAATTHGTQVGHVAFGGVADDQMSDLPLLGVQLTSESVARTNGFLHDLYVKSALNWAVITGLFLNDCEGQPELFVNHSFGNHSGRHDGAGLLEADFDRRLKNGHIALISTAAGNSFQSATHARLTKKEILDSDYVSDLTLVVQPDDRTTTFVQFWADVVVESAIDSFPVAVSVYPPGMVVSGQTQMVVGTVSSLRDLAGKLVARMYCQRDEPKPVVTGGGPSRRVLTLAIAPTATETGERFRAPAGDWKLRFSNPSLLPDNGVLAMWVERGDTPEGFPSAGRQAYFEHPGYQRRTDRGRFPKSDRNTTPIQRYGTLTDASTARCPLVVTSYRDSDGKMSDFSSASSNIMPTRKNIPVQPSLAAVSEASDTRSNILTTGSASGSTRFARGTSFSAPFALRKAIYYVLDRKTAAAAKAAILAEAEAHESSGGLPGSDKNRYGAGRLPGVFEPTLPRRAKSR